MNQIIAYRKPNVWYNALSFVIAFTFLTTWLPFLRSILDGDSYQWGLNYFGLSIYGSGLSGDFYFLIIQMLLYMGLISAMYWFGNRRIFYTLLGIWYIHVFGNLLFDIIVSGDAMFHGDTLNVHISLFWIVIPLSAIALFLIYKVVSADMNNNQEKIPWSAKNRTLAIIILGMLPIQAFLLASGEPHETTDEIGVIMALSQCFMLPFASKPYITKNQ